MEKDVREERLRTPEVLYILQRLDAMDDKYDKKIDEVNRKIEALRLELKGDILNVRDELRGEIKSVQDELRETKKEMTALFWRIVGIIVAVQGATIAILQFLK